MTLKTESGTFDVAHHENDGRECLSMTIGEVGNAGVLVRLHSSCLFGEAVGACDCDCGPQLRTALREIAQAGAGVLIYSYEEGRGAGIVSKIQAMELQRTHNLTTYEAYDHLGIERDTRDYVAAIAALRDLNVNPQISLISNNPLKVKSLEAHGFVVERLVALSYAIDRRASDYLRLKRDVGKHSVDLSKLTVTGGAP